ncbi:YTH domain-containing protein 1 [Arachnomyces sp. PD_36]|nr:YTH domain-containing protein 1 [Arachnomyces sp. PD_36]
MPPDPAKQEGNSTKISSDTPASNSGTKQTQPAAGVGNPTDSQARRPSPLNLSNMATALPHPSHSAPYHQQHFQHQFATPTSLPQQVPIPHPSQGVFYPGQFPGQVLPGSPTHNFQYAQQFQYYQHQQMSYGAVGYQQVFPNSPTHMVGLTPMQQHPYDASSHGQPPQAYGASYGQGPQVAQGPQRFRQNPTAPRAPAKQGPEGSNKKPTAKYDVKNIIVDGSARRKSTGGLQSQSQGKGDISSSQNSSPAPAGLTTSRGGSRKPKQTGHALWVGNLPPGTNIIDLRDHFFQDVNNCIESVFLISKSNCAFVNYKTDEACVEAMTKFHDSRFQGIKLVCRLRRGSIRPGLGTPINSSSTSQSEGTPLEGDGRQEAKTEAGQTNEEGQSSPSKMKDRYFVVKSLTIEDLELSRESGVWATQTHNEDALNQAYKTAENVYLIFSANKTGEYFGYARMASAIDESEAKAIEMPARPEHIEKEPEPARITETPATALSPKGHIVDDIARGTVFWEADIPEEEAESDVRSDNSADGSDEGSGTQTFGKPFRIEWVCAERLPFYRTRGLRNPWNANREVKIARDGTEIEPSVGKRLTQLFHLHPGPGCPTGPSAGAGAGSGVQLLN